MRREYLGAAGVSLIAISVAIAAPAQAAETTAGTVITNNVTVNYKVGGVDQDAVTASNSFTVDRKVNLTVVEDGNSTTSVAPGQTSAVTAFTVTNSSNATIDIALAATNRSSGTAAHGGTDNFNVSNIRMYVDTNNDGSYTSGTDQQVTYLDQVAADATVRVFVLSDVPLGRATGDVAGVRLAGTASEATAAGSLGATISETTTANTSGMDTVFADTTSGGNIARDGIHFAEDDYTVSAADVTVTKTSKIISDPFNGTTNPKMIPGSVVEYCISVGNASGSATATSVAISDTLPSETTYDTSFGVKVNGTVTASSCNADGNVAGAHAAGVVTGTIPSVAAGDTRTVLFRVTVN
jgi:uncharacterized repeat protein (TIGR01451 family)